MDVEHYVQRMEQDRSPGQLEALRDEIVRDGSLSEQDRGFLTGRVGMYLADADREQRDPAGGDPDTVPDEEDGGAGA